MEFVVAFFGLFLVVLGFGGLAFPSWLVGLVGRLQTPAGLYFAAGVRLVLGVALIFSAPDSRAPSLLAVFGVVAIVAGLVTPLFGLRRFAAILEWWSGRPPALVRAWCVIVLLLGAGLVWAVAPGMVA
jgi:hypothetical protein